MTMEKKRVSFLADHLYPNEQDGKLVWSLTADGRRSIAHQHGLAGIEPAQWELDGDGNPVSCTVTVLRRFVYNNGKSIHFDRYTGTARWNEFVGTKRSGEPNYQWKKRPFNQLSKCAEMQALRRGFPEGEFLDESGLYSDEAPEIDDIHEEEPVEPERTPEPQYEPERDPEVVAVPEPKPEPEQLAPPPKPVKPKTIEELKEQAIPVLKRYCNAFNNGQGMSWKEAYKRTAGVIDTKPMDANDYQLLISAMRDELEATTGER
jgi:hypothetical protein